MRLKRLTSSIFILITGLSFSACSLPAEIFKIEKSDATANISAENVAKASADLSAYSDTEIQMLKFQYLEETVGISKEEYLALADLYKEVGLVKEERDILEKAYRLFEDEAVLTKLESIAVDITEETAEIQSLILGIESEETLLKLLEREDFEDIFLPKLYDGKRTYIKTENGKIVLLLEVGAKDVSVYGVFGEKGIAVSKDDYILTSMSMDCSSDSDVYSLLNSNQNGAFTKTTVDLYNGSFSIEKGELKNGKLNGDLSVTAGSFDSYNLTFSEVIAKIPEMNSTEYIGCFDENGKVAGEASTADMQETLSLSLGKDVLVYAYSLDKKKCLYKEVTSKDFTFGTEFFEISQAKKVAAYEVKDKSGYSTELVKEMMSDTIQTVSEETEKVRVYDGEVQYFDGKKWVSCGTIDDLSSKDPFAPYEEKKAVADFTPTETPKALVESAEVIEKQETAQTQPASKPSASKTTTSKPATASKPAVTAPAASATPAASTVAAQPASSPEPSAPAPSNPTPSTPSTPEPSHTDPTPTTPSEPSAPATPTGGDTDVSAGALDEDDDDSSSMPSDPSPADEWTDDDK